MIWKARLSYYKRQVYFNVNSQGANKASWYLILPSALLAASCLLPLAYLGLRAMQADPVVWQILWRPKSLEALWHSLLLTATVTFSSVIVGLTLAWISVRTNIAGRKAWSIILALPLVFPSFVGAYTFIAAFGSHGMIANLLGIEKMPSVYGFWGAFMVLSLFSYPYVFLTVRAALSKMDPNIEEAARTMGKSQGAIFKDIILPQLNPSIQSGALLVALYTLSDFGAVSMLQFDTLTRMIYVQYESSFNRTGAAFLALSLVAITIIILLLNRALRSDRVVKSSASGKIRPPRMLKLGRWKIPALLLCIAILSLGLILPVSVIVYWMLEGINNGEFLYGGFGIITNSVLASILAAIATIAFVIPSSRLQTKYPGKLANFTENAAYLSSALPGIVIALSLVFFSIHALPGFLYQSLAVLVFAYMIHFVPHAMGCLRSSFENIDPNFECAARNLGAKESQVVKSITLPLLKPGVITGAALVFLTCMKELPATLLLAPTGFDTLATRIWSATEEGFFARAATPALCLVLVSGLSIWIILSQEDELLS